MMIRLPCATHLHKVFSGTIHSSRIQKSVSVFSRSVIIVLGEKKFSMFLRREKILFFHITEGQRVEEMPHFFRFFPTQVFYPLTIIGIDTLIFILNTQPSTWFGYKSTLTCPPSARFSGRFTLFSNSKSVSVFCHGASSSSQVKKSLNVFSVVKKSLFFHITEGSPVEEMPHFLRIFPHLPDVRSLCSPNCRSNI